MSSRIALITVLLVCCKIHTCKAEAVSWAGVTCPVDILEDKEKENLYVFKPTEKPSGYTILKQNVTGRFSIAPNGTLSSATKLDYESTEKAYSLDIMMFNADKTKNDNKTCVIQVIGVNDERPQFDQESYSVNIPNNVEKGANVLNVTATDRDVSETLNTAEYSIKEGGDKANFTINGDTGVINAAYNITGPKTFVIIVVVTDTDNTELTDEASVSMCIGCTSGSSLLQISMFAFMALVFGIVLM